MTIIFQIQGQIVVLCFSFRQICCNFKFYSKLLVLMSVTIKVIKYIFIFFLIAIFTCCAPAKKNPFYEKRKKNSQVNASQLGRNKYYFSPGYQKKLNKTFKKK